MYAIVLTGPPGVGKTAVLTALQNALSDDGVRHAAVEVEALAWTHPQLADSDTFAHLAALRSLYATEGYDLILCAATVTSPGYLDGLLAALSPDEQLVICLDAETSVLQQRIIEREPASWSGLPSLLSAADEIARSSRLLEADAAFATVDKAPSVIAEAIRGLRPDVLLPHR